MLVLGLSGGFSHPDVDFVPDLPAWFLHDAAAVLLEDGDVVCAVEEERLSRIKHTNRFPVNAVRRCLAERGTRIADLDRVAYFFAEDYTDRSLLEQYARAPGTPAVRTRELIRSRIDEYVGEPLDPDMIEFVPHHLSHAQSANAQSGQPASLVLVMDGQGEGDSLSVYAADGWKLELLGRKGLHDSLGHLYSWGTELLGYRAIFDEYKLMGLAPYGRPEVYRDPLTSVYQLLADGDYTLDLDELPAVLERAGCWPPRTGETFGQNHQDFAAGLQEAVETIVFHVISHWREETGLRRLAIAGGVGQNCTLNGKLAGSGLFSDVFVHPAAHDAGAALGAAAVVIGREAGTARPRARHAFWGPDLPAAADVLAALAPWDGMLEAHRSEEVERETAEMLAAGEIVGWVQGRSEFGPRALGNRSILADPRPAANRDRVNQAIKRREAFRPFAPSVKADRMRDYFVFPAELPAPDFMVFTVPVRPEWQAGLGAVTHVDGSARVHAVDRAVSPRYWRLLDAFETAVGLPMLLNTSFNNSSEPIVDSVEDAVTCFLTTELDALVVGDVVVRRRAPVDELALVPTVPAVVEFRTTRGQAGTRTTMAFSHSSGGEREIDAATAATLALADGRTDLRTLAARAGAPDLVALAAEVGALWTKRLVRLGPAAA